MERHDGRAAAALLSLLFAISLFIVIVPDAALARDPALESGDGDAAVLGGEPGEDPHLRVNPVDPTLPREESELLLATGADYGADRPTGIRLRSGEIGMRAELAWRLMWRSWLWTLQR